MTIDKDLIKQIKITPILESLKLEDISDEVYFGDQYSKNYISNSRLGVLKKDGAKAFFEGIPQVYNSSFETGSLIHTMCLQSEDYEVIEGVYKPTAKAGLMADALYKADGTTPTDDEIKSMSYIIGYYKDKLTFNRLKEFRQKAEPYWRDRFIYEQNNPIGNKERVYTDEKNYELLCNCLKTLNSDENIQKLEFVKKAFDNYFNKDLNNNNIQNDEILNEVCDSLPEIIKENDMFHKNFKDLMIYISNNIEGKII